VHTSTIMCISLCERYAVATISSRKKLQVSFAENGLFYRALLQKRRINLQKKRIISL